MGFDFGLRVRQVWSEAAVGFLSTMPLWVGVAPFGVAYALAATAAGLVPLEVVGMSLLVYAGTAQVTAIGLIEQGAGLWPIAAATLMVNLRLLLPSGLINPYMGNASLAFRAGLASILTEESYAVSLPSLMKAEAGPAYLFGSSFSLYCCWQASTAAGLLLGGFIPPQVANALELVVPLSFLALMVPHVRTGSGAAAAVVGGATALFVHLLVPGMWYILTGVAVGCVVGALVEGRE